MEFLVNIEIQRRQYPFGEAFLVAVLLVAATKWRNQQKDSEKLYPRSESRGNHRMGRQGQILVD
jgi:hypothetical protein